MDQQRGHWSRFFPPWFSLLLAIVFGLVGAVSTKSARGMTAFWPSNVMFVSYMLCAAFLSFALDDPAASSTATEPSVVYDVGYQKGLDLGVAYATWSGTGCIVTALAGVYLYGETLIAMQWLGIVVTIIGIGLINVSALCGRHPGYLNIDSPLQTSSTTRITEDQIIAQYGSV